VAPLNGPVDSADAAGTAGSPDAADPGIDRPSEPGAAGGSVIDFYRSVLETGRAMGARYRLALWIEGVLIVAWAILRILDVGRRPLEAWYVVAAVIALIAPVSGLVLLAAIAPFSESVILTHELGMNPILLVVIAASVGLRVVARIVETRRIGRPPIPLVLAALLGIGTVLGVVESERTFGRTFGIAAAQLWLAGIGGGLIVLGVAFWVARRGSLRPFVVIIGATMIGGVGSLVEFFDSPAIRTSPLAWMVRGPHFGGRLAGLISSPNGVAAVLIVAGAALVAVALLRPGRRVRLVSAIAALPLVAALYLTYSRAALLGLFATAVIVAWRFQRRIGLALLVLGIVGGAVLLPRYLESRFAAAGDASRPIAGGLLVASDEERITAWGAAARMWASSPITGHGFGSYAELGPIYGDPILNSPHSEWLRLFAEEGFVVGLIGLAFVASVLVTLARTAGWIGGATLAAAVGYFIAASFNNPFLFLQVGVPAFVVIGTGLASSRRRTEGRSP
jgi:O-Antigen ligase